MTTPFLKAIPKGLPYVIFWGWNALFFLFIALLVMTGVMLEVLLAAVNGSIPISFVTSLLILVAIPCVATLFAVRAEKFDQTTAMKLFFAVEIPLFIAAVIRLFVMRQLNFGTSLLLISILIAACYFLWTLTAKKHPISSRGAAMLHALPAAIMLVVGVGAAVYLAIYALPLLAMALKAIPDALAAFFSFDWLKNIGDMFRTGFFGLLFIVFSLLIFVTGFAFIVAPVFMATYYAAAWGKVRSVAGQHIGTASFAALSVLCGVLWLAAYINSGNHPEANTVARLAAPDTIAAMRDDIERNHEKIREDLLDAYLYRYRYLQPRVNTDRVAKLYSDSMGLPKAGADAVQALHNFILTPLFYAGTPDDDKTAARLYHEIFDQPIQKAEKDAIRKALQATWNRAEVEAGLLDIDARKVFISEQRIDVEEHDIYATIEIEEVYENQTTEQQEVYYYFSLPEDAAVTGLWLGFGEDRSKYDSFIVAPRGAAQAVYEQEVQRRVDPALLEQVGPRQYRLRAFPVPPKHPTGRDHRPSHDDSNRLHMRFAIAVPTSGERISMPILLEKRNVFWSRKTQRTLNQSPLDEAEWLPAGLQAAKPAPETRMMVSLPRGYAATRSPAATYDDPLSIALVIDTSWSVHAIDAQVKQAIEKIKKDNSVDAQLFVVGANGIPSTTMPEAALDQTFELKYFGKLTPQQMVTTFQELSSQLPGAPEYDAILVLTDQGTYESDDKFTGDGMTQPVWFVHVGLAAFAYDDAILDLIYRTGGGVTDALDEAISAIRAGRHGARLSGNHEWRVATGGMVNAGTEWPVPAHAGPPETPDIQSIAARQAVISLTKNGKTDLSTLDGIHSIAVAHNVVTPFSSMIVLVNERQRKALEDASKEADRFAREANTGEEDLTAPIVAAVPEPHEWMLIIVAALLLGYIWYRQRYTASSKAGAWRSTRSLGKIR